MKHRRCARPCPVTPVRIRSSASRDNRTLIASVRPRDLAGKTRRWLAVELTGELEATGKKTRALDKELTELVTARGSTLPEVYGIGPSGAARLLANAGDIHRFARRDRFASWNGTAPLDASSGSQARHRLSRAGNRRINRVLHIMAVVQRRNQAKGLACYGARRAGGMPSMMAMRALRRRLSNVVFSRMLADRWRCISRVLVGSVVDQRAEGGTDSPHYQIRVRGGGADFRVAVNVLSQEKPAELLYAADENFRHPVTQTLPGLPDGFTPLASQPGGMALDFIRANLFDRQAMQPEPASAPGPDNDLADKLDHFVRRAAADPAARLYAFGQRWGPEAGIADKIFGFLPGNGVHDIHMNQGNSQRFRSDDGVWQDGGLLLHYPAQDQWVAIFLAFQSQAWHTDDQTGHTVPDLPGPGPTPVPRPGEPDHVVRIIAALVNPPGPAPEAETVTLLNASPQPVDLTGWSLLDRAKHQMTLQGRLLPPGDSIRIQVAAPVQLGNHGGLITLLNPDGLKVDGVAYTQAQADAEGWSIIF